MIEITLLNKKGEEFTKVFYNKWVFKAFKERVKRGNNLKIVAVAYY